jgi:hypothetical protein
VAAPTAASPVSASGELRVLLSLSLVSTTSIAQTISTVICFDFLLWFQFVACLRLGKKMNF